MKSHRIVATVALGLLAPLATAVPAVAKKQFQPGLGADATGGSVMDPYAHLGSRTLRKGLSGHDVKVAQDMLTKAGHKVRIDGSYGKATVRAVKAWEQADRRAADGVLTPADAEQLIADAGQGTAGAAEPVPLAPGDRAVLNADGTASAPASAPQVIKDIIAAGNEIATKPYRYGGGHGTAFTASAGGFDCSGSVSYALHGGGLLQTPRDSTGLESFGSAGPGTWVTIYANSGHTYMYVAGLRFDTSGAHPSRWQAAKRSGAGYVVRHPDGL